jgi:hypothetical protein
MNGLPSVVLSKYLILFRQDENTNVELLTFLIELKLSIIIEIKKAGLKYFIAPALPASLKMYDLLQK